MQHLQECTANLMKNPNVQTYPITVAIGTNKLNDKLINKRYTGMHTNKTNKVFYQHFLNFFKQPILLEFLPKNESYILTPGSNIEARIINTGLKMKNSTVMPKFINLLYCKPGQKYL